MNKIAILALLFDSSYQIKISSMSTPAPKPIPAMPLPVTPVAAIKKPTALAETDRHHHHDGFEASLSEENKFLNKFLNFNMENRSKEDKKVAKLLQEIQIQNLKNENKVAHAIMKEKQQKQ